MTEPAEQKTPPEEVTAQEQEVAPAAENKGSAVDPRIAELEAKVKEANDKMLRALAEADNTRKRLEKERQDTAKFAIAGFARDLLSVADNLRRALEAIKPEQIEQNPEMKAIAVGVEMTERELLRVFEKNGIQKMQPLDQPFDPNLHEVIFEADMAGKAAGTVVQVAEQGYTLHERLLRPAKVGVAKGDGTPSGGTLDEKV